MAELSSDDAVVRVKEVEFAPLTEEEALIQIDLLGHDFFVYTDRDTNEVNVLYRRKDGGYGKPYAESINHRKHAAHRKRACGSSFFWLYSPLQAKPH